MIGFKRARGYIEIVNEEDRVHNLLLKTSNVDSQFQLVHFDMRMIPMSIVNVLSKLFLHFKASKEQESLFPA